MKVVHYWPRYRPNTSYCGTTVNRPYTDKRSDVTCKTCLKAMTAKEQAVGQGEKGAAK